MKEIPIATTATATATTRTKQRPPKKSSNRRHVFGTLFLLPFVVLLIVTTTSLHRLYNSASHDINNNMNNMNNMNTKHLQDQINNLRSQISALQSSQSQKIADDPRFFPFVIRDSRHLTPVQVDPDFNVFDYVNIYQPLQPESASSQLLHNGRIVIDDELEAQRNSQHAHSQQQQQQQQHAHQKYQSPCQEYSTSCYRQKVLQVFSYVLKAFPEADYYFYIEADNDLCVPMSTVRDLALAEKRYFIGTGIGGSGWIMRRDFLTEFVQKYTHGWDEVSGGIPIHVNPDVGPDLLASWILANAHAWAVTRQYWVSHTTLESVGVDSLTVKDYRNVATGKREKLGKHLPRCLEPHRAKWMITPKNPHQDPRDQYRWDYFDYEACPNEMVFPCKGQEQLEQLVAADLKVAIAAGLATIHDK